MRTLTRPALAVGSGSLAALALTACAFHAADAPRDASKVDFCHSMHTAALSKAYRDKDTGEFVDALHKLAGAMRKVGTPAGIPAEARRGFEIEVGAYHDLTDDQWRMIASARNSAAAAHALGVTLADYAKVTKFSHWSSKECADVA